MAPCITDIGDRILVTKAENETDLDTPGNTWLVQDMSLFFTRVQRSKTGEVAIISNATLAKSRIINFRKSGRARVKIPLKFAINASYNKIHLFRKVVLRYVEDRPQEFVRCIDFQLTRVEHESGFLEYLIILQSRDSCQEMDQVLENKMKATRFLFEVQKKLEIAYKRNIAMPSYPEHILRDKKESVLNSKEC
jgi:small-conductance mechanosensitive channel